MTTHPSGQRELIDIKSKVSLTRGENFIINIADTKVALVWKKGGNSGGQPQANLMPADNNWREKNPEKWEQAERDDKYKRG